MKGALSAFRPLLISIPYSLKRGLVWVARQCSARGGRWQPVRSGTSFLWTEIFFCNTFASSASRDSSSAQNAEAWSNLGAVLTKLEEINGAQTAYKEGLKCNRSHWRIWENLLTVSLQLEDVCTCLEAVSEIVNLRTKWDNLPQLTLLLDLIMQRARQYEINSVDWHTLTEKTSQMLECIGNVGITDPCFWLLCALALVPWCLGQGSRLFIKSLSSTFSIKLGTRRKSL
ncbi:tetratricopeptide repeat protein 27 homolog [Zophobas morio]|uniref:tetratricopeptide repeat protein 27 homolog n=1 Tax=Zophobas morio TaxID=2755281 RepID=UPI0030833CF3